MTGSVGVAPAKAASCTAKAARRACVGEDAALGGAPLGCGAVAGGGAGDAASAVAGGDFEKAVTTGRPQAARQIASEGSPAEGVRQSASGAVVRTAEPWRLRRENPVAAPNRKRRSRQSTTASDDQESAPSA